MFTHRLLASVFTLANLAITGVYAAELPKIEACFVNSASESGVTVTLEVAREPAERRKGLMGRESLAQRHGMLFIYPELNQPERGFWMYKTLMPLDIAYLGSNGQIASIRTMSPCPADNGYDCPNYPAGVPFMFAVEMREGFYSDHNLAVGDRLIWNRPLPDFCAGSTDSE